MNSIPIDVARIILEFILYSKTIKAVFFINNWWYTLIKNSKFWKKYNIIRENTKMSLEDSNREYNEYLVDNWEKYNGWKWSKKKKLIVGKNVYVDVLDRVNTWCPAIITDIQIIFSDTENSSSYSKKMTISFLGWNDSFNEIVDLDKIKPFGSKTIHPVFKYESLKNLKETSWVLYKSNKTWGFSKMKIKEVNEKNIIVDMEGTLLKLTKENINSLIKTSTNGNSFLCRKGLFLPYTRELKF